MLSAARNDTEQLDRHDASPRVAARAGDVRLFQLSRPEEAALLLPLVRAYHEESPFAAFPLSEHKVLRRVIDCLNRRDTAVGYFAVKDGRAVGLIEVVAGPPHFCDDGRFATCLAWYVHPDIRGSLLGGRIAALLLRAAKRWATEVGATGFMLHGTHGKSMRLAGGRVIGQSVMVALG